MLRFSLRSLLALVLFLAVGIAALRGATAFWASVTILLALGAICTASLGAALRRGDAKAPWLGFAIFGWSYFLLCLSPWGGEYGLGPARFLTFVANGLLLRIDSSLVEFPVAGREEFAIRAASGKSKEFFQGTFHAIASVLFGVIGAIIGRTMTAGGNKVL